MIHVKQTRTYEGPEYRGNCYSACVASIFELPIDRVPDLHGGGDSALNEWLAVYYPGVRVESRDIVPTEGSTWKGVQGLWIATVESPRYTEECRYHTAGPDAEEMEPFWWHRENCPHCCGGGERPGYHAVVAEGRFVKHDPHPAIAGYAWEYNGRLCGWSRFVVVDPARLSVRRTA